MESGLAAQSTTRHEDQNQQWRLKKLKQIRSGARGKTDTIEPYFLRHQAKKGRRQLDTETSNAQPQCTLRRCFICRLEAGPWAAEPKHATLDLRDHSP